jgi:NADPH oxidase
MGGFVQRQTNFEEYPISDETGRVCICIYLVFLLFFGSPCSPVCLQCTTGCVATSPTFKGGQAGSWMWVVGPLSLYLLERLYRLYMSQFRQLKILKVFCLFFCLLFA